MDDGFELVAPKCHTIYTLWNFKSFNFESLVSFFT